jgi:protein-disulfide isomerase
MPSPPPATPRAPGAEEPLGGNGESPVRAEPTIGGHDAEYWRQRAEELQQTLDDPTKLQEYFAEKARQDFEAAPVESIDLDGAPRKGPADAPVTVVEYSDFLCPFCRNLAVALSQFVPQAGGRVAVYFKNYPLDKECNEDLSRSLHPGSCQLALGALCAQYQDKFEAYHDRVFTAEGLQNPGPEDVIRLAGEAGLNPAAMAGCLRDPETEAALDAQIAEAQRLEVHATPTLFINGKMLPRINDFVPTIDREAQKRGFPPLGQ